MTTVTNRKKVYRAIVILVFAACLILMRYYDPQFQSLSHGAGTLDMRFHYGAAEAYRLLDTLGASGRLLYIRILLIDFVFIMSFALVQNFILKSVMGEALLKTKWKWALGISYLRGIMDLLENASLQILICRFPSVLSTLAACSGFFTTIKFVFIGLWLVAIPVLFVARMLNRKVNVQ